MDHQLFSPAQGHRWVLHITTFNDFPDLNCTLSQFRPSLTKHAILPFLCHFLYLVLLRFTSNSIKSVIRQILGAFGTYFLLQILEVLVVPDILKTSDFEVASQVGSRNGH